MTAFLSQFSSFYPNDPEGILSDQEYDEFNDEIFTKLSMDEFYNTLYAKWVVDSQSLETQKDRIVHLLSENHRFLSTRSDLKKEVVTLSPKLTS